MKQIYQLDLPPIESILIDSFNGYNDDHLDYNYIVETDLNKVIHPQWQKFLNLEWMKLIYFKKQERQGGVHSDVSYTLDKIPPDNNLTTWGINWVYKGQRIMLYWDWEDVIVSGFTNGSINIPTDGVVTRLLPIKKPREKYILEEGNAYLVNATLPHRAIGKGSGKIFSYRPMLNTLEWDKVVNLFTNYIKM